MKGVVLAFLTLVLCGIGWRYVDRTTKRAVSKVVRDNIITVILAALAITLAVVFSANTTLRLL